MNVQEQLQEKIAAMEALQAEKGQIKVELEVARTELASAIESNGELNGKLTAAQESMNELNAKVEQVTAEVAAAKEEVAAVTESSQAEIAVERGLKETLELQLAESTAALKKHMAGTFNALRKVSGMAEMSDEELLGRTNDSLRDGIKDMIEGFSQAGKLPTPVPNPSLSQDKPGVKSVKESTTVRNIDLEQEAMKIFSDVVSFRK